jgi:hypothetical protein
MAEEVSEKVSRSILEGVCLKFSLAINNKNMLQQMEGGFEEFRWIE